jgi:hypothetical protein
MDLSDDGDAPEAGARRGGAPDMEQLDALAGDLLGGEALKELLGMDEAQLEALLEAELEQMGDDELAALMRGGK